jgi:hypothetical protein
MLATFLVVAPQVSWSMTLRELELRTARAMRFRFGDWPMQWHEREQFVRRR